VNEKKHEMSTLQHVKTNMKQIIKRAIKSSLLYNHFINCRTKRRQIQELAAWERNNRPMPPPHIIKQQVLETYSKRYGLKILVETGTYLGDMVEAMKNVFERIYSIELSEDLYRNAKVRFKRLRNLKLINGDSGIEIKKLMNDIRDPALFWLDGHYSGGITAKGPKDTPIYEELTHIFSSPDIGHIVIIDDARCFGTEPAYPSLDELREFIKSKRPNLAFYVQGDSIRLTPKE